MLLGVEVQRHTSPKQPPVRDVLSVGLGRARRARRKRNRAGEMRLMGYAKMTSPARLE